MADKWIGVSTEGHAIVEELAKLLTKKRASKVSIGAAATEASRILLEKERKAK